MKPSVNQYSQVEARKLKNLVEERTLGLDILSTEDAALCKPYLCDLLQVPTETEDPMLSFAEAIWLPMAAEMIRSNYSRQSIFIYSHILLGSCLVPPGQHQIEVDGIVITKDSLRLLDQIVGHILTEKEDVTLQFTRTGEFGIIAGTNTSNAVTNCNSLGFSVHRLMNQTADKKVELAKCRVEKLTEVEGALIDTNRDSKVRELRVEKASPGSAYLMDIIVIKSGMVKKHQSHALLKETQRNFGKYEETSQKWGKVYYRQELRHRYFK